jgi:ATP-binding cassette subfamily A (ABC1) protein 3
MLLHEISSDGWQVLWDSLTVQEHIKIWRRLKTPDLENLTVDDEDVLVECDLVDKVGAAARTLSGGQMRKLQLAIAFVGGSKVCCIDEASSGMVSLIGINPYQKLMKKDPLSRRTIWNIIAKGRTKRTTLITSHFLDEVRSILEIW